MPNVLRFRYASLPIALALVAGVTGAPALADLQMVTAGHSVVTGEPSSSCSAKAKTALDSVLSDAVESDNGSGEWLAYGMPDSAGHPTAAASIHCYPLSDGYDVAFACAAQVPPSSQTATALCDKIVAAFPGAKAAFVRAPATTGSGR